MGDFVTIKTFQNAYSITYATSLLDKHNINFIVLDELMAQMQIFSYATKGIRLQVEEKDVKRAVRLLQKAGIIELPEKSEVTWLAKTLKATAKIPWLGKLRVEWRFMVLVSLIVLVVVGVIYVKYAPTLSDRLTSHAWCIENVRHNGKTVSLHTVHSPNMLYYEDGCDEKMSFLKNGTILFPGINSAIVEGKWKLDGKSLQIKKVDTFENIYNGNYTIDFSGNRMILTSQTTTVQCLPL